MPALRPEYWRQIDEDVSFLTGHQQPDGSWGNGMQPGFEQARQWRDHANTHLALLAATEAAATGAKISGNIPRRSEKIWLETQNADGGWGFSIGSGEGARRKLTDSYGAMTVAGLDALYMIYDHIYAARGVPWDTKYRVCGDPQPPGTEPLLEAMSRAWNWLDANFSADRIPTLRLGVVGDYNETLLTYYQYLLARVGNQSGRRLIGQAPWCRQSAESLVANQQVDGSWGSSVRETCFGLLALLELRQPLIVQKVAFGPEETWNRDPRDLAHLLVHYNGESAHPVSWEIVHLETEVNRLGRAPVLYFSGQRAPVLNDEAKQAIYDHVWSGGTILVVPACARGEFGQQMMTQLREIFPLFDENPLPADHALWTLRYEIEPGDDVVGLGDATRTPILFLNNGACCAWHQHLIDEQARLFDLGVNVLEYATFDRGLPNRFDRAAPSDTPATSRHPAGRTGKARR